MARSLTPKGVLNRPVALSPERSVELLGRLLGELALQEEANLAWAKISLPLKNILLEADVRVLDAGYQKKFQEAPSRHLFGRSAAGAIGRTASI